MEAKDDFGITNHLRSKSIMQIPHPVKLYSIEKLQVKLSLHDIHERMLYMYIYVYSS